MTETSSGAALLQFEVVNQVATLTLNSPSKRNAMEPAMRDELASHLRTIRDDTSIRAVIITGAGGHFCSGGDLRNIASANLDNAGSIALRLDGLLRVRVATWFTTSN